MSQPGDTASSRDLAEIAVEAGARDSRCGAPIGRGETGTATDENLDHLAIAQVDHGAGLVFVGGAVMAEAPHVAAGAAAGDAVGGEVGAFGIDVDEQLQPVVAQPPQPYALAEAAAMG